jgi:hypothetical protein
MRLTSMARAIAITPKTYPWARKASPPLVSLPTASTVTRMPPPARIAASLRAARFSARR